MEEVILILTPYNNNSIFKKQQKQNKNPLRIPNLCNCQIGEEKRERERERERDKKVKIFAPPTKLQQYNFGE